MARWARSRAWGLRATVETSLFRVFQWNQMGVKGAISCFNVLWEVFEGEPHVG